MAIEKLRMPTGAVLVTVNIEKFKWNFKGSDIKNNNEPSGTDPTNLVVKDLGSNITKPTKWKSISECIFRVKKIDSKSKTYIRFRSKKKAAFSTITKIF